MTAFNPDTLSKLPSRCAVPHPYEGAWIITIKGMQGYLNQTLSEEQAAVFNAHQHNLEPNNYDPRRHSTQEAMRVGSMFGWEVPGADPAEYAEEEQAA
jgi:hypothetical protein